MLKTKFIYIYVSRVFLILLIVIFDDSKIAFTSLIHFHIIIARIIVYLLTCCIANFQFQCKLLYSSNMCFPILFFNIIILSRDILCDWVIIFSHRRWYSGSDFLGNDASLSAGIWTLIVKIWENYSSKEKLTFAHFGIRNVCFWLTVPLPNPSVFFSCSQCLSLQVL